MGIFNFGKKKTRKQMEEKGRAVPRTIQDSIPYQHVFRSDGTIETRPGSYTRAYKLEDINFKATSDDEQKKMVISYMGLLNAFPVGADFQIVIINHAAEKFGAWENIRFEPQRDGLNSFRNEMNQILSDKLTKGSKSIAQDKYIVISKKAADPVSAQRSLDSTEAELKKSLRKITNDASVKAQGAEERMRTLHGIYNQEKERPFYNKKGKNEELIFDFGSVFKAGLNTKDVIGPDGMEFNDSDFMLGSTYGRALFLEAVPNFLTTEFISDLTDTPCRMIVSVHHTPLETSKTVRMIHNYGTNLRAEIAEKEKNASKEGYSTEVLNPELATSLQQTNELLDDILGNDEKPFHVTMTVCVFGNTKEEMEENAKMVIDVADKYLCRLRTWRYFQEQAFNQSLPLCLQEMPSDSQRLYTTRSAAVFIPYTTVEINQKEGIYYGTNQVSKNMIMYSRKTGDNYNGLIFGKPGSGKSFLAKSEMVSVLLRNSNNRVYVIDPEAEYVALSKSLHGEVVEIRPNTQTFINPMDMDIDYGGEADPIGMKADYVVSMLEIMLGQGQRLDPQARAVISRCVSFIYKPYIEQMERLRATGSDITCDKGSMPTLARLYNELREQPEPEAQTIANIMESYVEGNFALFSHRSNVDTDAPFVVYNIKHLGSGTKELGLHVCLNDIWNKMIDNRKKGYWTWIYIDEAYLLLKNESSARFLSQVWRRARKWHGIPTGIMQDTDDVLRNDETRSILKTTSCIIMMNLPKPDQANMADLLQISDAQMEYVQNSEPGHGLLYTGKAVVPFANEFPSDTELYRIMNTK